MGNEWKEYRLGEVTRWSSGGTPPKKDESYWNGDIPWISASSMYGNRYAESKLKITPDGLKAGSRLATKGSILLLVRGSMLHQKIPVGIAERDVSFNQDVKAIKVIGSIVDPWFLLFWFMSNETDLLSMVENTGIGAGKLDTTLLQNMLIQIPPLKERQAIVGFAKALDDKIELNRKMNVTLEGMAQALFKSWFVDFDPVIDNALEAGNPIPEPLAKRAEVRRQSLASGIANRKALPAEQAGAKQFPAAFQFTEELGWVPEGWEVGKLSDLLEVKYGKDHKKLSEGSIPVYGSGGLMRHADKSLYSGESVLIPRKGTLSNILYLDEEFWTVDTMFYTIPKGQYFPKYAFYHLKSLDFTSLNVGSAVPSMTTKVLNALPIIMPDEATFQNFDTVLTSYFDRIYANNKQSETLTKLRDTLLPKLISGELRIPEAEKLAEEVVA
jgi:type I restriction enzyme, S subunit